MARVIVYLPDETFDRLRAKAEANFRDVRQQAALAIVRDLDSGEWQSKAADTKPQTEQAHANA
jgi:hypothetical protein